MAWLRLSRSKKKLLVTQPRINAVVHQLHLVFYQGLVAGLIHAGRQYAHAVVVGQLAQGTVDPGFIGIGLGDSRLEVVRNQYLGYPSKGVQANRPAL